MSEQLRRCWSRSRIYRVVLAIAVIYAVVRLAVHGAYLAMMLYPNAEVMGGTPEWAGSESEPMVPDDLRIYLDAANRLRSKQDLYMQGSVDRMEFYQYAPSFALVFTSFLWLSRGTVAIIHTLLHIVVYLMLYLSWARIFHRQGMERASEMLAWTLPVWLIFSAFWSDLGYLNVYILTALLSTLLIEAIMEESLGWSLLWLTIILQIKPQWAFAAAVPLLIRRFPFFFKLLTMTVVIYIAVVGLTTLVMGPTYGWEQHVDYFRLLGRIQGGNYPWRGPEAPFLGYNHSIKQIAAYVFGPSQMTLRLATVFKVLLLVPLVVACLRYLLRSTRQAGYIIPRLSLDLAFALYLGAFIWLDVVWELSLGIAVFTYLLATLERRSAQILVWVVFLPYALVDFFQLAGFVVFGMDAVTPGLYILTDPSIYIPMVMIVILTFYTLLVKQLWEALPICQSTGLVSS